MLRTYHLRSAKIKRFTFHLQARFYVLVVVVQEFACMSRAMMYSAPKLVGTPFAFELYQESRRDKRNLV